MEVGVATQPKGIDTLIEVSLTFWHKSGKFPLFEAYSTSPKHLSIQWSKHEEICMCTDNYSKSSATDFEVPPLHFTLLVLVSYTFESLEKFFCD